eukprot:Rhum_TRINITY_DN7664_c0_g1::Rhum_TRINITY_DN7664_c0_g1_i1::g.24106::m.24106
MKGEGRGGGIPFFWVLYIHIIIGCSSFFESIKGGGERERLHQFAQVFALFWAFLFVSPATTRSKFCLQQIGKVIAQLHLFRDLPLALTRHPVVVVRTPRRAVDMRLPLRGRRGVYQRPLGRGRASPPCRVHVGRQRIRGRVPKGLCHPCAGLCPWALVQLLPCQLCNAAEKGLAGSECLDAHADEVGLCEEHEALKVNLVRHKHLRVLLHVQRLQPRHDAPRARGRARDVHRRPGGVPDGAGVRGLPLFKRRAVLVAQELRLGGHGAVLAFDAHQVALQKLLLPALQVDELPVCVDLLIDGVLQHLHLLVQRVVVVLLHLAALLVLPLQVDHRRVPPPAQRLLALPAPAQRRPRALLEPALVPGRAGHHGGASAPLEAGLRRRLRRPRRRRRPVREAAAEASRRGDGGRRPASVRPHRGAAVGGGGGPAGTAAGVVELGSAEPVFVGDGDEGCLVGAVVVRVDAETRVLRVLRVLQRRRRLLMLLLLHVLRGRVELRLRLRGCRSVVVGGCWLLLGTHVALLLFASLLSLLLACDVFLDAALALVAEHLEGLPLVFVQGCFQLCVLGFLFACILVHLDDAFLRLAPRKLAHGVRDLEVLRDLAVFLDDLLDPLFGGDAVLPRLEAAGHDCLHVVQLGPGALETRRLWLRVVEDVVGVDAEQFGRQRRFVHVLALLLLADPEHHRGRLPSTPPREGGRGGRGRKGGRGGRPPCAKPVCGPTRVCAAVCNEVQIL